MRRADSKAGVSETVVMAIYAQQRPPMQSGRLGVVCEAVDDILAGAVMDERFARCEAQLGPAIIAELLVTIDYFSTPADGLIHR